MVPKSKVPESLDVCISAEKQQERASHRNKMRLNQQAKLDVHGYICI